MDHLNLVKLCVGIDRVEDLEAWQIKRAADLADYQPRHVTRMWPKRAAEILAGGSLYWVIKGFIQARQTILRLDEVIGQDGIRRCGIIMEARVIRTESVPRRPFQGWRYFKAEDAPRDLAVSRAHEDELPHELSAALAKIGIR